MSSETTYKIKIRKGDLEIEVQGDKEWVEIKYNELKNELDFEALVPSQDVPSMEDKDLPMTLSEFIRSKPNVSSNADEMAVYAYWLYHKKEMSSFNLKDIRACYNETRITVPTNPGQYLGDLQRKGFIKKLDEKKEGMNAYIITPTGENFVENDL